MYFHLGQLEIIQPSLAITYPKIIRNQGISDWGKK